MLDLDFLMNFLKSIRHKGYGKQLPGEPDNKFIQLADLYLSAENEIRNAIRNELPDYCRMIVLGFGDRMVVLADRLSDRDYLLRALVAHAIEDFRYDERENIIRLVVVNHVCEKLGEDPLKLFEEIANLCSDRGASAIRAFSNRSPALKTLDAMEIVEKKTTEGVSYQFINDPVLFRKIKKSQSEKK